ncbi:MAG: hypothetical protein ACRECP_10435 [Methylocella sp.]
MLKLLTELTAHRTLALREAIGNDPATAFLALPHVLSLKLFYRFGSDSCFEIEPKSVMFGSQAPGLGDTPLAVRVDVRHHGWIEQLPKERRDLWNALRPLPPNRPKPPGHLRRDPSTTAGPFRCEGHAFVAFSLRTGAPSRA